MKAYGIAAIVLTLAPISSASGADRGFFVGASAGYSNVSEAARTDLGLVFSAPQPPLNLPDLTAAGFDGVPFDDNEFVGSAFVGFRFNGFASLQLGYADLGEYKTGDTFGRFDGTSLRIRSFELIAQFRYPISRVAAIGMLGATKSTFDASGQVAVVVAPADLSFVITRFAEATDPVGETGYLWGCGIGIAITKELSTALTLTRRETDVLTADTLDLSVVYSF